MMYKYLVQFTKSAVLFVMMLAAGYLQAQESQRMVVSSYMVRMPMYGDVTNVTVADLKKDIFDAHGQGISAFQINIHNWKESNARQVTARLYQAASECDFPFYLFPSVDYNENDGSRWLFEDISDYMRLYAEHPNHLQVDGRPFFTSWLGQRKGVDFWLNIKERLHKELGLDIYYVPFHAIGRKLLPGQIEAYLDKWDDVIDGYFSFGGSTPPFPVDSDPGTSERASISEGAENLSAALKSRGLSFMTPVIPAFWATCKTPCKYTEHQGAKGMAIQWMSIINNQTANWVNLVTWNDLGEDSHWSPHPYPNRSTERGPVWTHAGYAELNKYYIQWWKSGQQPPIERDKLFYFYRNQFQDATPLEASCPHKCDRRIPDKVYVTTMLTSPATLTIKSGTKITVHEVPAGIQSREGELGAGIQSFTIVRDGEVVLDATGRETVDRRPEYKSWSLYSGFATGEHEIITQTMGMMTDPRDGQIYKTVSFEDGLTGTSITWITENLNYKTSGSFAYENNEEFRDDLGLLYTWEAATKACPGGWHLPSDEEWEILINKYGGEGKAGEALKGERGWYDGGNGTNISGFNGLPAGCSGPGGFGYLGKSGYWWSSTVYSEGEAWRIRFGGSISEVTRIYYYKHYSYSCRCVRD